MAAGLVGLHVLVLLNPPDDRRIQGRVANVLDQHLFLEDVFFVDNASSVKSFVIPGQSIADLDVIPHPSARRMVSEKPAISPSIAHADPSSNGVNGQGRTLKGVIKPKGFTDPAILSYVKPSVPSHAQELATPSMVDIPKSTGMVATPTDISAPVSATLSKPFNNLSLAENPARRAAEPIIVEADGSSLRRPVGTVGAVIEQQTARPRKSRPKKRMTQAASGNEDSSPEVARPSVASKGSGLGRVTGWRQTPMLQEIPAKQTPLAVPTISKKEKSKRKRAFGARMDDGFGTEDATDIQALDDFDFVGNLSKFDKKAVFEQLRNEDTTADEELLINHNRLAKPGTFQGTKLHPFENVLQRQRKDSKDPFDSEEDFDAVDVLGSRPPYRAISRSSSARRIPVRSASKISDGSHQQNDGQRATGIAAGSSPKPQSKAAFRYASGRTVPCVWPTDIQEAEERALSSSYGLTSDIIAENAARNIAELALSTISPDGRRFAPGNHNTRPVVVILVGDGHAASRALAAGRHLQNRGIRVIASAVDSSLLQRDISSTLSAQIHRLKGSLMTWSETSQYLKTLDAPPELIIDALSGTTDLMAELLDDPGSHHVKDTAFQMMAWANKSRASCMAVDCPFGVNPSNGQVQVHEGEPAEIRAKVVACSGAPVTGVLAALQLRHDEGSVDEWRVWVCDIGINPMLRDVTKEHMANGRGRAIAFGSEWMVRLQFEPSDA